jgi:hypothetical protein
MQGVVGARGKLAIKHLRFNKRPGLWWKLRNLPRVWRGLWRFGLARLLDLPHVEGRLYARLLKATGQVIDFGLVSARVVTTAFVNFMVDQLQTETSEWGDFKYHDCGTGTTAAAVGDTAMETQYGGARATGNQGEGASANIYQTVGTISFTSSLAITEHGVFSQATGTTLLDRHVFSAINVADGDSIQFTYELTCSAGG